MLGVIFLFCVFLLIYLLWNSNSAVTIIKPVIAGAADSICEIKESKLDSNFVFFLSSRHLFNRKNAFIGRLTGESMSAIGLHRDDVVLGKYIHSDRDKSNLRKGDLLIIEITDPSLKGYGSFKIREFSHTIDKDYIQTVKYINNCQQKSSPHKLEDVVAVVNKYVKSNRSLMRILETS
jgi:hypothetical protein